MTTALRRGVVVFVLGLFTAHLDASVGPIRVSQDGRYFVDRAGAPLFWLGDTQWELFLRFDERDAASLCEKRVQQGFSVVQIMLLGVGGGRKSNAYGDKPLVNDDPLTPNERYFRRVDSVLEMADRKNLICVIGIYHKTDDYGRLITLANARPWAKWVGERYRRFPNVIWSMYPEAKDRYTPIVRELAAGLREGDGGGHLITVHPDPSPASSSQLWHDERWLSFNTIQTWNSGFANYRMAASDYARTPVKPVVDGEARYEAEGGTTPLDVRRGAYWSFLAGGFYSYGHGGNWLSPGEWKTWIDAPGASQMAVYRRIVTSIPRWWTRVPDPSILVDDPGSSAAPAAAARSAGGDWILAYLAGRTTVTVRMNKITAGHEAVAFWMDPKTGKRMLIGTYPTTGQQSFTTPAGWEDAVLLVAGPGGAASPEKSQPGQRSEVSLGAGCWFPAGKGYIPRPCGFDMNRNGILGEPDDRHVGDGVTKDPDGDGVEERLWYVDARTGDDAAGDGSPQRPFKTIQKAIDTAAARPADGAEDIVCIHGTFHESLVLKKGGVPGHCVRDGFQFPRNPFMLIGWDKNRNGRYPPYDKEDEAVLDGENKLAWAVRGNARYSCVEIAHLTVRNYGYRAENCGALDLFTAGEVAPQSHVYIHDVELQRINKGEADQSGKIVVSFWGGPFSDIAMINCLVDQYSSYFCRGAPPVGSGRFRFQNNTLRMFGTPGKGFVTGWKLWGPNSHVEILDNVLDCNAQAWKPIGYVSGVGVCQGTQDWVIRGNLFVDLGVTLQPYAAGFYQGRPLDNIVIDRNVFRSAYSNVQWGGRTAVLIEGYADADAKETVKDVAITNNFMYSTAGWAGGITSGAGNGGGPTTGTLTIAGNTICGPLAYTDQWGAKLGGGIRIVPNDSLAYKQRNYVIKNNVIANTRGGANVEVSYAPPGLVADGNVYDPGGKFRWNDRRHWILMDFAAWQKASGQDLHSRVGCPSFANAKAGDLHLAPDDRVARGAGVDVTPIAPVDFDGDPRAPQGDAAGADVPPPSDLDKS